MYRPNYTKNDDNNLALQLVEEFPLGHLCAVHQSKISSSFLPFVAIVKENKIFLLAHLARANPQSKLLDQAQVEIFFQGPNRYMSPTIYHSKLEVPTWNYAVVKMTGTSRLVSDPSEFSALMSDSVQAFEKRNGTAWDYNLPADFKAKLMQAIVGVEIEVSSVQNKFKLSQNKSDSDYQAVFDFLSASLKESDQQMLKWMNLSGY